MKITDLAFPYEAFDESHKGLTKREYIATKVLAGLISDNTSEQFFSTQEIVEKTIEYTDELLKQLSES